jgi:uncharacterized repeat protein (TIGR01451 family)
MWYRRLLGSWLRNTFGAARGRGNGNRRAARQRCRLQLEQLESRTLLAVNIVRTSASVFYTDNKPPAGATPMTSEYASFQVTNTGAAIADAWATIGNFTAASGSPLIGLAANSSGQINLGPIAAGATVTAYFYLGETAAGLALGTAGSGVTQSYTVSVFNGSPTGTAVVSQNFSFTNTTNHGVMDTALQDVIAASANKVTTVVTGPVPDALGGIITMTVTGKTGTIGSGNVLAFTPASYSDWRADAYQMISSSIVLSGGNTGTFNDRLLIPDASLTSSSDTNYTATYRFRAVGTTATPTEVDPTGFFSSGTQTKHTDPSGFAGIPPITPAQSTTTLAKSVTPTSLTAAGQATYTLTLTNASASIDISLDRFVDTLPSSPANVTYVAGSSTYNGAAIADPTVSGQTLTWYGLFNVPHNSSVSLVFQANVPATNGTYTNSAVAFLGTTQIDTTLSTTDNAPATASLTEAPQADLQITKTDGQTTAVPGSSDTYTIVVSNAGPSSVTGATVTDTLPAILTGATFTASGTGGASGFANGSGNISQTVNLPVNSTITYTVTATISAGATGTLSNTATVTAPSGVLDPSTGNNSATDSDTLSPKADLRVSQTVSNATPNVNDLITYTITLTNAGPSNATGVSLLDQLPAGLTFQNASTATGSYNSGTGVWTVGNLANGGTDTLTITAKVVSPNAQTNTASVNTADQPDPNTANNSSSVTETPQQADLQVNETVSNPTPNVNDIITYTVTVKNAGPNNATNVSLLDALPAGLSFQSVSTATGSYNSGTGVWTIGSLANGATDTVTITAKVVSPNAQVSTVSVNTADQYDPDTTNNSKSVTVTPQQADVAVVQAISKQQPNPGDMVTYTITVTDNGPNNATNLTIADVLPLDPTNGLSYASNDSGGSYNVGSGVWTIGTLNNGGSVTLHITATYNAGSGIFVTNTASIRSVDQYDPVTSNNSASVATPGSGADLKITKTDGQGNSVNAGGAVTYTITVTNLSGTTVSGATVTDTLPGILNGVTDSWQVTSYTGTASSSAGLNVPRGGNISDSVHLAVNDSITYTLTATISPTATGTLSNTALVTPPAGVNDTDNSNNSATDDATVHPVATNDAYSTSAGSTLAVPASGILQNDLGGGLQVNGPAAVAGPSHGTLTLAADGSFSYQPDARYSGPDSFTYQAVDANGQLSNLATVSFTVTPVAVDDTYPAVAGRTLSVAAVGVLGNDLGSGLAVQGGVLSGPSHGIAALSANGSFTYTPDAGYSGPDSFTYKDIDSSNQTSNTATVSFTVTQQADLLVTKSDGSATAVPGQVVTYTIAVHNAGPSDATGATVTDDVSALPLTGVTYTASVTAGTASGFTASGSGSINDTAVSLAAGSTVTYVLTGTISPSATGTLSNSATVTPPPGTTDPTPGNNTGTDTDTLMPLANLTVAKDDGSTTYTPGTDVTYTITVANPGPSDAQNVVLSDALPAGTTFVSLALPGGWARTDSTAIGANGTITAGIGTLPAGSGTQTFTLVLQTSSSMTGNLANTATVTSPTDPIPPTSTDTDTPSPQADLSVIKSDGSATAVPGQAVTYTITVRNAGPSDVFGATITDDVSALPLTGVTYTASVTAGTGSGFTAAGSGSINDTAVNLAAGSTLTYVLTGTISPSATGTLSNSATASPPPGTTDPTPGNNTGTDTDTLTPLANLTVAKDDGSTTYTPGTDVTYTITVANPGPSDAQNVVLSDALPAGTTFVSLGLPGGWSRTDTTAVGANGTITAGIGTLAAGSGAQTFTLVVHAAPSMTGNLANTATVTSPTDPTPPTSTDTDTANPQADLGVTIDDGKTSVVPGTADTYTITVTNNGPSSVSALTLTDTAAPALLAPTFTPSRGTYTAGTGAWTGLGLAPGQSITLTVTGTINPAATGNEVSTATVSPPAGVTDPNSANNSASDTDTLTPQADLAVTKTDGKTSVVPGTADTYTITVTNNGPSTVTSLTLADTAAPALVGAAFTPSTGTYTSGTGAWTGLTLARGQSITLTVTGTINPAATGNEVNTATVSAPAGVTDPNSANNSATDTDTLTPQADLSVTKTDGKTSVVPGTADTYTITVSNNGPSTLGSLTLTDNANPALVGAVFTPSAGVYNSGTGAWTGLNLASGQSITLTVTGTINPAATGTEVNTATVSPPAGATDPNSANNSATDKDTLTPQADLAVTDTDGKTSVVPGTADTYTITVSNNGPSTVNSLALTDAANPALLGAVFTPSTGTYTSGTGTWTGLTLAKGQSITLKVTGTINPVVTGTEVNTATVSPPAGVTDPNSANNSASDTDTLAPQADLAVTDTDGKTSVVPGTADTYTITISNNGPTTVSSLTLTDAANPALLGATFTASTGTYTSGTGAWTGLSLASGQSITLKVTGTINPAVTGTEVNTATVSPPAGVTDPNSANNSATDTDTLTPQADLAVTKTDGKTSAVPGTADTYTIAVTNNGPSAITSLTLTDTATPALVGPTFKASTGTYSSSTGAWTGLTLASGQSVTLTVTGTISASGTGTEANTATASPPAGVTDPSGGNNSATDTDTLTPQAEVKVFKTGPAGLVPGLNATYTISVTNAGPSDARNVVLADSLPAGETLVSQGENPGGLAFAMTGVAGGSGISDSPGTLPNGASATFQVVVAVAGNVTAPTLTNTATVTSDTPDGDGDSATDRSSTATTPVIAPVPATIAPLPDVALNGCSCGTWNLATSGSFSNAALLGPWVGTVDYGDGGGPQTLTLTAGQTFNLSHVYAQQGVYQVSVTVTNVLQLPATTSLFVGVRSSFPTQAPGQLFTVNDGSAQRSMVTSLTVTFAGHEDLAAGAFTLTTAAGASVGMRTLTRDINGQTVVLIQFTDPTLVGGSLADGQYNLVIDGSKIHDQTGAAYNGGGTLTESFFRLFGDSNGDRKVDNTDLTAFQAAMRSMYGTAPYLWYLDYTQDCTVDAASYSQFMLRYGQSI